VALELDINKKDINGKPRYLKPVREDIKI